MKTVACFLVLCLWLAALSNLSFADDEQLSDLTNAFSWFDSQSNDAESSEALSLDELQEAKHKHKSKGHKRHKPQKAPAPTSPEAPTPSPPPTQQPKAPTPSTTEAPTPSQPLEESSPSDLLLQEDLGQEKPHDNKHKHKHHKHRKAPKSPKSPTPSGLPPDHYPIWSGLNPVFLFFEPPI